LHSFNQRIIKKQPIVAPNDVKRYFVTPQESGELCLLSCLLGENNDIFFPKLSEELHLITFSEIAERYLAQMGYKPFICKDEEEARELIKTLPQIGQWPCYFSASDTTGEKDFEEFYMEGELLDMNRFENIGIVKNSLSFEEPQLRQFTEKISSIFESGAWSKVDLVDIFKNILPAFDHKETGKYLDAKM